MPSNDTNSKDLAEIIRRGEELAKSGEQISPNIELLAAISDGAVSFDEMQDEAVLKCIEEFGLDALIDALLETENELSPAAAEIEKSGRRKALPDLTVAAPIVVELPRKQVGVSPGWRRALPWVIAAGIAGISTMLFLQETKRPAQTMAVVKDLPVSPEAGSPESAPPQPASGVPKPTVQEATGGEQPTTARERNAGEASKLNRQNLTVPIASSAGESSAPLTAQSESPTEPQIEIHPSVASQPVVTLPSPGTPVPAVTTSALPQPETPSHSSTRQTDVADAGSAKKMLSFIGHTPTTGSAHYASNTAGHSGGAPAGTTASKSAISHPVPKGSTEHVTKTGSAIRTRSDGHVSDVHDAKRGIDVHHGLDGGRRVSRDLPGHGRMYAERGRPEYVQRGYGWHGHDFERRAYYWHGREYNRYYYGYVYRGMYLNVYAPGYYYSPGFYGWAYNPWAAPISFGWGWAGTPWFGFYGGFFNPSPVYASAALWLTDYIIAQDLQAAYTARQEGAIATGEAIAAGGPLALTPEAKQLIADEVKAQIALENFEAAQTARKQDVDPGSSGVARLLADGKTHVFVVGDGLDLTDSTGAECAVSEGDALQLVSPPASDATTANLVVLASKGGKECQRAATVAVNLTDLQEMQNHMRETIDAGLKDLQAKQGTGGIPAAPTSAQAPPTQTEYAAVAPPPDPKDATDLQAQSKDADATEAEVTAEATSENGSPIGSAAAPSVPPERHTWADR